MIESFGTLPNGEDVQRITIGDDDFRVSVLTYGATMQSIHLADVPFSLCLGFNSLQDYLSRGAYVGAIVGRVANRISGGRSEIDSKTYDFNRNENGKHTLHGGPQSLSHRNWTVSAQHPNAVVLKTTLPSGENGFPGTLDVTASYEITNAGSLDITLAAQTDQPTLCNLAPHPYFNLNGGGDAREQRLAVNADSFTTTDDEKIPTGELASVAGTAWDHRTEKRMLDSGLAYDHNFCLSKKREALRPVARLTGTESGISMEIETTEPGLQVYDGAGLARPYSGIALEPQCWPDAPNHAGFPSILLRPDETSRQVTRLKFTRL